MGSSGTFLTTRDYSDFAALEYEGGLDRLVQVLTEFTCSRKTALSVQAVQQELERKLGAREIHERRARGPVIMIDPWFLTIREGEAEWYGLPVGGKQQRSNTLHPEKLTGVSWSRPRPKPFMRDRSASGGWVPEGKTTSELSWERNRRG